MSSFYSLTGIEADTRAADQLLKSAFKAARNRHAVTAVDRRRFDAKSRHLLSAVNAHARISFGRAMSAELAQFFCDETDNPDHNQSLHFVTLIDVNCVTSVSSEDVAIPYISRRLRRGLRGLSYLAVIEPAFYVNLQVGVGYSDKRCLSWHLHAVVWGVSSKELKERIDALNRSGEFVALVPGRKGAHAKRVRQGTLPEVIGYMLKPTVNGYRVTRYDLERNGRPVVNEDGEVQARFISGKQELRPGQRVDLFHVMKNISLDQLTIAGGQGVPILMRAKRVAVSK